MFSKFFLDRPVLSWVIAIMIIAAGVLAIYFLPVSQYPNLAPPSIMVMAFYPGASAETVENTVTQIIEQKMTGLEDMIYMSATSDSAGTCMLELTFAPGTDPDIAWSKVQNKLQLAMAHLPEVVQRTGIEVGKATKNYLLAVGLISEDNSMNGIDIRDYLASNIDKVISRVPGVGETQVMGFEHAMRIWLNPDKLTNYHMTVEDVVMGLRAYNVEVSAGQFGGAPAVKGQRLNANLIVQSLLKTPEEFGSIPLRTNPDGSIVRVKDVGRVAIGTDYYDIEAKYNGKPSGMLIIRKSPGANALDTANAIKTKMKEMSRYFPDGLKAVYPYDTTPFIRASIREVVKTLIEAIVIVFLVMWLFLGNLRTTMIPTIEVPIVVLGAFACLGIFGFSINMLTMFAMVLSIGMIVDDVIVIVENVERIMTEEGLSPYDATAKTMSQIIVAVISMDLVIMALFAPIAFFPGSTGLIYRQFSVTICGTMMVSLLVALVLTPTLCATILRPVAKGHEPAEYAIKFFRPFFVWFDKVFFRFRDITVKLVGRVLARKLRYVALYIVIVASLGFLFMRMQTGYLPDEDQGVLLAQILMPTGATLEQTQAVADKVQHYFQEHEKEAVESCATVTGFSFSGRTQNNGMVFIKLKDWDLRNRQDLRINAIIGRAMAEFSKIRNANVFVFGPPAIIELGNSIGFDFQLMDRGGVGHAALTQARNQLLGMAAQDPRLIKVRPNGLDDVPEYRIDVDWEKAGAMGVPITSIHNTISAAFGGAYVNDFIQAGRIKHVWVQLDAPYRMLPKDLEKLYVRNTAGKMVPFSSFASAHWTSGSPRLERYNAFPSMNIWGEPAPGYSSGDAMEAMEELASKLPQGIGYDWSGLSYQERQGKSVAPYLYTFAIFVVFLYLAGLYASWTIPITVLLIMPLGLIGGTLASSLRGLPSDIYFQIGLLITLGLATKNAILIVQFAKEGFEQGAGLIEAALHAVKLRLRPVLMTAMTTGLSVIPLAIATGAGAGAMKAIGTALLGGMVTGTILVVLFAPLFYVIIEKTFGKRKKSITVKSVNGNTSGVQ